MTSLRVLFVGGLTSYRALFNWLSPWIAIPVFVLAPIFQILLFAYVGRAAGVGDDAFFVIGNSVQYACVPCLWAMGSAITGERQQGTLPLLLVSPARRVPLFIGRAFPVVVNGLGVALVSLAAGAALLGVRLPASTLAPLALVVAVSTFSCTGLGLVVAAVSLRVRDTSVMALIVFGVLLIFSGANVPVAALPGWMAAVAQWLPMTHGIDAARRVAAGSGLGPVGGDLAAEAGLGVLYLVLGLVALAWLERQSRRLATLDTF
jgi:ABC-2 type transport system permease protein